MILMGHSMGGAVASKTVELILSSKNELAKRIKGIVVIDALETIAKEALPYMKMMFASRP